ncbi:hypothetical protein [Lewinella sp. JB7]|uniref:hypothetical protein n=1 Tax=Lewinella sp. JB7 TaxID=2962887 RepID=UPI0020C99B8C|nr:hypothetical protein [Lewinella sp. JB7]MCP9237180.1 hypothetical protein [Lewinella sp. JB7]
MRILLILMLLGVSVLGSSQTKELELLALKDRVERGELSPEEFRGMAQQLSKLMTDMGGYPHFPVDSSGTIKLGGLIETNLPRNQSLRRLKEWSAIHSNNYDEYSQYVDEEHGRLIVKHVSPLLYSKSIPTLFGLAQTEEVQTVFISYTMSVYVKDGLVKLEFLAPSYSLRKTISGTQGGTSNVQVSNYVDSLFPITNQNPREWKNQLEKASALIDELEALKRSMKMYLDRTEADYGF